MSKTTLKRAAITRTAFEYQDLIGIELLINFFRDPKLYRWVAIESEDPTAGSLDDVVAERTDGKFEYIQVKFTVDPDKYPLDWDWLLERTPRGTSRLKKWADSLSDIVRNGSGIGSAQLRTNRQPDDEFKAALKGEHISLSKIAEPRRGVIETELGGRKQAAAFFKTFRFQHSEHPDVDGLERQLKGKVVPTDTTSEGWLLLRSQVRRWATHKSEPEPDGKIRHAHLVQLITKRLPTPIPQNFLVPDVYAVPSEHFHHGFLKRITSGRAPISILWGTPGRGKSTYLSYLCRELAKKKLPVVRHHYFLSLTDTTTDRISFSDVALSIIYQINSRYPDVAKQTRGLEESSNQLRKWITACGEYFAKSNKKLFIVIDGLDHVWRDLMNIEQMNHLFNSLLPCPKNVVLIVGTQRVADDKLPSRLLTQASPSAWIEVPPMDERAVQEWIIGQHKAKRLRLDIRRRDTEQQKEVIDAISKAFFQITHGHPLHLIYSFETLVRRGASVTADEVKLLPRCPDGDIRKYYRILWGRINPQGKKVLHLIAGSEFRWPSDGLQRCAGSLDEVDHLLEHRRTGIVPFHGSILAYAREQADHQSTFKSLLPNVIRWLEREAPEYWRWGWLWIIKAKNGKDVDLLTKTTREWLVGSLARGLPANQIISILREAESAAFAKNDYCRSIYLRSLKIRMQNGPEFQMHRHPDFLEATLRSSGNTQQLLNMADDLGSLPDQQIVALLHSLPDELSDEIGAECEAELRRRVNLWLTLRHRPSSEFLSLVAHSFEALARLGNFNVKHVLRFLRRFQDGGSMFRTLLSCLERNHHIEPLMELASLLKSHKDDDWRIMAEDTALRVSIVEGADLRLRLSSPPSIVSPLMGYWLSLRGEPLPRVVFTYDPTHLQKERHEYGPDFRLERFFYEFFFTSLVACRNAVGEFSFVLPGVDSSKLGWMATAIDALRTMAKDIADGRLAATFATPFLEMKNVAPVSGRRTTEADSAQYWSFKAALGKIALDLHLVSVPVGGSALISAAAFSAARESRHWHDDVWLSKNLENRLLLLETPAAQSLLNDQIEKETITVTAFNERAERWVDLSLFALLYGLPHADVLAKRAADCLVSYGYHKDPYIFDVLDSILQVQGAGVANALSLLKRTAPIVDQIMEFTDGDDIGSARNEVIELVSEICPQQLPDCYAHYIRRDKWELAQDALAAHVKKLDFSNGVSRALSRTLIERKDLMILSELKTNGSPSSGEVFLAQERFVGGIPQSHEHSYGNSSSEHARSEKLPDVSKFKPSQFKKLVEALSSPQLDYNLRNEALTNWLQHWKTKHKGGEALQSIEKYFKETERTYSAEHMLDDAFLVSLSVQGKRAAYKWLVRAHIARHGWQSHWTSSAEVIKRLEWAATYYKDKWQDFIRDTSKPEPFWERRNYGFSLGLKYLVRFLLLVDQKELAAKYTLELVDILVEEVNDQPLPELPWLQ